MPNHLVQYKRTSTKPLLIEVTGLPKMAKKMIVKTLAYNFGGQFMSLPNFKIDSHSGTALLQSLAGTNLMKYPEWWALMTAANFTETGITPSYPVLFTTNYKHMFQCLFELLGVPTPLNYLKHLPTPNVCYALTGARYEHPAAIQHELPEYFLERLNRKLVSSKDNRVCVLDLSSERLHSKYDWVTCNNAIQTIQDDLMARYQFLNVYNNYEIEMEWLNQSVLN